MRNRVVLAGALAQKPGYAGHTWVYLNWLLGFRRLDWDVLFLDSLSRDMCDAPIESSTNLAYLDDAMRAFGLEGSWSVLGRSGEAFSAGLERHKALNRVRESDLLINVGGYLDDEEFLAAARSRVYLDIDPGFGQMWRELGLHDPFAGHDIFVTIGENVGQAGSRVPTCGLNWITTRQPVVLDLWPARAGGAHAFTSIGSWRGPFAPVEYEGVTYGLRVHEFRKFVGVPRLTGRDFELALDIHAAEVSDLRLLKRNGWRLVPPRKVAGAPNEYRDYVGSSKAEFMVAKNMYVATRSGWFSDRSACYLASGRPVIVQDTGLDGLYPVGEGLLTFSTVDEAAAAVESVASNYVRHARAAREIAESEFASDRVLRALLDRISASARR